MFSQLHEAHRFLQPQPPNALPYPLFRDEPLSSLRVRLRLLRLLARYLDRVSHQPLLRVIGQFEGYRLQPVRTPCKNERGLQPMGECSLKLTRSPPALRNRMLPVSNYCPDQNKFMSCQTNLPRPALLYSSGGKLHQSPQYRSPSPAVSSLRRLRNARNGPPGSSCGS